MYKKTEGGYLSVKYDALLQCVTTRDVSSYTAGYGQYGNSRVKWIERPRFHVAEDPRSIYDSTVNRSRLLRKNNWLYVACAASAAVHFLWMLWGLAAGHGDETVAAWLIGLDLLTGMLLRAVTAYIAKCWNRGSWLQIILALASPTFWSIAYSGGKAIDVGWVWSLPLLSRVLIGLVCLVVNSYEFAQEHATTDYLILFVGLVFGMKDSFDLRVLGHYFMRTRSIVYEVDLVFMAASNHMYAFATRLRLLGLGRLPAMVVTLGVLAAMESLCLMRVGYALEDVMRQETVISRMHHAAKLSILAGSAMVCDFRKGIEEEIDGEPCAKTYVTWVVRGAVSSVWNTAAILLPGPWDESCRIEARDVASCPTGDDDISHAVCCVCALRSESPHAGDTSIGLQPILTDVFGGDASMSAISVPRTFYVKSNTGFIRTVGAGVVGLPVM